MSGPIEPGVVELAARFFGLTAMSEQLDADR